VDAWKMHIGVLSALDRKVPPASESPFQDSAFRLILLHTLMSPGRSTGGSPGKK
jgi:hypothetical protein